MPTAVEELKELSHEIKAEKTRIAAESALIQHIQAREEHWRDRYRTHDRCVHRNHKAGHPKKMESCARKRGRDKRKVQTFHKMELDAIEFNRDAKAQLKRLVGRKHVLQVPKSAEVLKHELEYVGTPEGSKLQVEWAHDLGYSASLPWCSIFQGYFIKHVLGLDLPPNPAYSGSWLVWRHGQRINVSQIQPGDLIIFDWGDGGITDHVGMYAGHGLYVSGNHGDRVDKSPVYWSNVVGVVRITN